MRKCCCCDVKTASILLGVLNVAVSVMVLFPLAAYLADTDVPNLNPIKENHKYLENVLEDLLREHNWTSHNYMTIMIETRTWFPTAALIAASLAAVSATAALMLIVGVRCRVRCLMVPFLVLTMIDIILAGTGGIVVVVGIFYANYIPGVVSVAVYIILAILSLFSWTAVLAAYKNLSHVDYMMYSPAPSKPGPDYYPSAPQHFDMDEYRGRKDYRNQFG